VSRFQSVADSPTQTIEQSRTIRAGDCAICAGGTVRVAQQLNRNDSRAPRCLSRCYESFYFFFVPTAHPFARSGLSIFLPAQSRKKSNSTRAVEPSIPMCVWPLSWPLKIGSSTFAASRAMRAGALLALRPDAPRYVATLCGNQRDTGDQAARVARDRRRVVIDLGQL
jgi:hypothetical protein